MTPFGAAVRRLRAERGITQRRMAHDLGVSAAYLSALEHGQRSAPNWQLVQRIIGYFNIIWDEAEELERLAMLSQPRIVISARELTPRAALLANRLAESFPALSNAALDELEKWLDACERSEPESDA
ncbi:helix-turn-helix domain-containing protein [Pseudohoeflea coraliihabitans]|uniref:Helix-turn-helix domain-containing protein n=1 Tax=Pseudohoeflea coraliihabitans TaxID=2860393 RepID=A0ABS6WT39_9HYPH|nr:helix-turn-helix domain-containing protein [Pseudohoeflea sp. DP4N28-3]MBW3099127.1 helix-turn-helix domain-containing protein [Pseudohoeflea sp. DP4N28-3]